MERAGVDERARHHLTLGIMYQEMGCPRDALVELRRVLRTAPDNAAALTYVGLALSDLGELEEAEGNLRRAIEADRAFAPAYSGLAATYYRRNRPAEARLYAEHALEKQPAEKRALLVLGDISMERGDATTAAAYYGRAAEAHPEDAKLRLRLARALLAAGGETEPLYHLRRALEVEPTNTEVRLLLGDVHERAGRLEEALEQWRRALETGGDDVRVLRRLSRAAWESGRRAEAYAYYKRLLERLPGDVEALRRVGEAEVEAGRPREAIRAFRELLERLPDDAAAHHGIARAYAMEGNVEAELEHLKRAVEAADPHSTRALLRYAHRLAARGLSSEAMSVARKLTRVAPESPEGWTLTAQLHSAAGEDEEALFHLQRAIACGSHEPEVFYAVAALLLRDRKRVGRAAVRDAERHLRTALRLDPDFSFLPKNLHEKVYRLLARKRILPLGRLLMRRRFLVDLATTQTLLFEKAVVSRRGFGPFRREVVLPLALLAPTVTHRRSSLPRRLLAASGAALAAAAMWIFGAPTLAVCGAALLAATAFLDALVSGRALLLHDAATGRVVLELPDTRAGRAAARRIAAAVSASRRAE